MKKNAKIVNVLLSIGIEGDSQADTPRPVSPLPFESFSKLKDSDGELVAFPARRKKSGRLSSIAVFMDL
ncbi:MAG: hypothetical protein V3W18_07875 [candidate division Zixibacteria bacterium]